MPRTETPTSVVATVGRRGRAAVRTRGAVAIELAMERRGEEALVERVLRRKIAGLRRRFPEIGSCRVAIDVPHRRSHRGRLHRVRIAIVFGGSTVRATRHPSLAAHEDARVAIHDAFAAVQRELTERAHRHEEKRRIR
jgi:ribosome-associated translation inhibitor RaiA